MTQPSFNPHGAVDLSSLVRPAAGASGAPGASGVAGSPSAGGPPVTVAGLVIDVNEADFQQAVIETSMTVPVVIDFWADWCGPCKQLSPVLERLAHEANGAWVLAKVDIEAAPRLGQAFRVESIPAVFAVVKGQPIPLFQGANPEPEVRRYLAELLRVAAENGVNGRAQVSDAPEQQPPEEPVEDPRHDQAYDAIERGDLGAAAAAYQSLLGDVPGDLDAKAGLGQVELMLRTQDLDPAQARARAAEQPDDVDAQIAAADLDLLGDLVEEAFGRLIDMVRRGSGEDRDKARAHLIVLLDLVGSDDDRVTRARTALANALF